MSKEWDINNVHHLKELVHALIIANGSWGTEEEKEQFKQAGELLGSYRTQYKLKEQLKESIGAKEKPFLIGDYVRSKHRPSIRGCVTGFHYDGKHMALNTGEGIVRIEDFELDETENDRILKRLEKIKNKRIMIKGTTYYGRYSGQYSVHEDKYISDNSFVQVYLKEIDCGGNTWVTIRNHKDIFEEEEKTSYENQKETIDDLHKRNKYLMDVMRTTVSWFLDRTRDNRELMEEWHLESGILNGCCCVHPSPKNPPKEE